MKTEIIDNEIGRGFVRRFPFGNGQIDALFFRDGIAARYDGRWLHFENSRQGIVPKKDRFTFQSGIGEETENQLALYLENIVYPNQTQSQE